MRTVLVFLVFLAGFLPAHAEPVSFGPSLSGAGWKPLAFSGLRPVDFMPEGSSRLTLRAERAASVIWRGLDESFRDKRRARWRWKAEQAVGPTDLARKGADDRAIALYFVFAKDEASARAAKGATSLQSAMWWSSGAALVYVWGGNAPRGRIVPSPHMGSAGKLVIAQPGGTVSTVFLPESVDLAADFRRAFGRAPGPLVGLAVSSDSDDTGGLNIATVEALSID